MIPYFVCIQKLPQGGSCVGFTVLAGNYCDALTLATCLVDLMNKNEYYGQLSRIEPVKVYDWFDGKPDESDHLLWEAGPYYIFSPAGGRVSRYLYTEATHRDWSRRPTPPRGEWTPMPVYKVDKTNNIVLYG